jgi:hypothetical protein
MYITYNSYIMNPYFKTNFGNTHIELLNLPLFKMSNNSTPSIGVFDTLQTLLTTP